MKRGLIALGVALALAGCSDAEILDTFIINHRSGEASDYWIEMKNISGAWERTGLIYGYADDYDECSKAIAGLKTVNYAREYRCTRAN